MDFDRGPSGHGGAAAPASASRELVRQFEQGAGSAKVEFVGVQNWGYDKGAYTVTLEYRVTTSAMVSEMVATAIGQDDENGERQWYMMDAATDQAAGPHGGRRTTPAVEQPGP